MSDNIGLTDIASAERILGIALTDAERRQLKGVLEGRLTVLRSRQERVLENSVPPATVFAPWLLCPGLPKRASAAESGDAGWSGSSPPPRDRCDMLYASVRQIGTWLRAGSVTSRELTELALNRLQAVDPSLHCVITLTATLARSQAEQCDKELAAGTDRGPLHGIPYGMKDIIDTAGVPTTWGAAPYQHRVPDTDAFVTRRLRDAGAVMVAKLSCGALAYGDLWFAERTRNPWDTNAGSSGSSAGSAAAVAAGAVPFAIGTETYGSIVSPSMVCGTAGLRPTFGTVSRAGAMALSFGFDKIGPIARRAADALLVLNAIAGPDERDAESVLSNDKRASLSGRLDGIPADGLDGLRIGFREESLSEEGFYGKGEDILDHLTRLGAQVTPMTMPETKAADLMVAMIAEAAAHHEQLTLTNRDDELSWQEDAAWPNTFRAIRFLSAVDYVQMQRLRTTVVRSVAPRLESVDAFVAPSFSHDLVAETNLSGHPAITVPVGLGTDKLPEAISVVGPWFGEAGMVRVAAAIEGWSDYLDQRPPV